MTRRVLITGSRDWQDRCQVEDVLDAELAAHRTLIIVHGNCPAGADAFADDWCRQNWQTVTTERYSANWKVDGRAAGPIRNQRMVDLGADQCLAFIRNGSRGATDCTLRAKAAGIPVKYFREQTAGSGMSLAIAEAAAEEMGRG